MAQPPPSRLSPRGLLSLPYRLCNPPPAVGKVRSCGVTPVLDVRLDDVLARQHLPPIGLKDFEEFLLYVEQAPENLYFILWLKEYTTRYNAWAQREKASRIHQKQKLESKLHPSRHHTTAFCIPPTPDPSLALFYARAKQTFFTPNAEYELNIPSDVLAPFHCAPHSAAFQARNQMPTSPWHSQSVHPDPAVFTEVAIEARNMLSESLTRFVRAAYTNVGSRRAACGIVAGCFFTIVGGVLPLVLVTGRWNVGPHGRLVRLVAFPGLWLGLTILIASLQGICLMVYVFGDLRQLRKFELARPAISRPIISAPVLQVPPRMPIVTGSPILVSPRSQTEKYQTDSEGEKSSVPVSPATHTSANSFAARNRPPPFAHVRAHAHASEANSSEESTSCESCESGSCSSVSCNEIDVSPAFFDEVPAPEGPATASCLYRPEYRVPGSVSSQQQQQSQQPQQRKQEARSPSLASPEKVHRSSPRARPVPLPVVAPTSASNSILPVQGNGHVDPGQSQRSVTARGIVNVVPHPRSQSSPEHTYGPSAGFIPNDYCSDGSASGTFRSRSGSESFDFDLLPEGRRVGFGPSVITTTTTTTTKNASSQTQSDGSTPGLDPRPLLGRAQYKCAKRTHGSTYPLSTSTSTSPTTSPTTSLPSTPSPTSSSFTSSFALLVPSFTAGVPAFAAPFTQVRSEVVKRAQWEVVVRAALAAFVCAGVLVGVVVGVVP